MSSLVRREDDEEPAAPRHAGDENNNVTRVLQHISCPRHGYRTVMIENRNENGVFQCRPILVRSERESGEGSVASLPTQPPHEQLAERRSPMMVQREVVRVVYSDSLSCVPFPPQQFPPQQRAPPFPLASQIIPHSTVPVGYFHLYDQNNCARFQYIFDPHFFYHPPSGPWYPVDYNGYENPFHGVYIPLPSYIQCPTVYLPVPRFFHLIPHFYHPTPCFDCPTIPFHLPMARFYLPFVPLPAQLMENPIHRQDLATSPDSDGRSESSVSTDSTDSSNSTDSSRFSVSTDGSSVRSDKLPDLDDISD